MRYRIARAALMIVVLALASSAAQAQQGAGLPSDKLEKIEKAITNADVATWYTGSSVAVVVDRQASMVERLRARRRRELRSLKSDDAYRLARFHPITAAAVMQLAERGKLDLDAPIQKYCPAFPQKQMARHRATAARASQRRAALQGGRRIRKHTTLQTASSRGSICLRMIRCFSSRHKVQLHDSRLCGARLCSRRRVGDEFFQTISGRTFSSRRRGSHSIDNVADIIPSRAQGLSEDPERRAYATPACRYQLQDSRRGIHLDRRRPGQIRHRDAERHAVKKETLDQMWTAQKTRDGKGTGYGLGWGVSERNGMKRSSSRRRSAASEHFSVHDS